jgi:hypothetical protein
LSFFAQERQNTLENGFLDLFVFAQDGKTRLMLSEHKTLNLYTDDKKLFQRGAAKFISLGYAQRKTASAWRAVIITGITVRREVWSERNSPDSCKNIVLNY